MTTDLYRAYGEDHGRRIWAPNLTPIKPTPARRKGHAGKVHPHNCYAGAGKYQLAQPDGILVQASAGEFGIHHCWVELPEGLAYDGVDGALYPTAEYREAIQVHPGTERRYTLHEVAHHVSRVGRWGPLEDPLSSARVATAASSRKDGDRDAA